MVGFRAACSRLRARVCVLAVLEQPIWRWLLARIVLLSLRQRIQNVVVRIHGVCARSLLSHHRVQQQAVQTALAPWYGCGRMWQGLAGGRMQGIATTLCAVACQYTQVWIPPIVCLSLLVLRSTVS